MVRRRVSGQEGDEWRHLLAAQSKLEYARPTGPGRAVRQRFVQLVDGGCRADPETVGGAEPPGDLGHRNGRIPRALDPPAEVELLPGHTHAVHAVIENDEQDRQLMIDGGMHLGAQHQEGADAAKDHGPRAARAAHLCADGPGDRVTHAPPCRGRW